MFSLNISSAQFKTPLFALVNDQWSSFVMELSERGAGVGGILCQADQLEYSDIPLELDWMLCISHVHGF